jgi:hypothetical protein
MIDINWKVFGIKNAKATESFESLCYFLFCRRFQLKDGVRTDFNQVGLETEPIKHSDGKFYGFQAKFFEKNVNYNNIADSIDKALNNYAGLNHIIIYLNQHAQTSCKGAVSIENKCAKKGVTVEWYLPTNFMISLNQPTNLDLAEFYFGKTDILKLLSDSKSIRMNTMIQSKEYIDLCLRNGDITLIIKEYCDEILGLDDKLHLFSGVAGSGKSVCMRKIFNLYGGFEKQTQNEQLDVVQTVGALCIFINLNNTSLDALENIVVEYKRQYYMDSSSNKFIYLFDGLDEIPSNTITSTLLYLENLLDKDSTKKIIISSRLSSYNKFILKATFSNISEYTIENLNEEQIITYFDNKGDVEKKNKFKELLDKNNRLYSTITDILTLSLLWEHIFYIKNTNYFTDLMEYSVYALLNNLHHIKYLETLNLPNPKAKAIITMNKEIAIYLFDNDKFSFSQKELQEIIYNAYPKCDYTSVNQIVSYLADVFFDTTITENIHTFSYRHRRFLEYFIILGIDKKIKEDLNYLRKNNIIINHDLFENMFLPYLQNKSIQNNDIPLAFEVGLFNVYLGNDNTWGVDKSFYYWSRWIIYSIAILPDNILQNSIQDKALPISEFFYDVPEKIINTLTSNGKISTNNDFQQYYINYILLVELMHKFRKQDFLPDLLSKYKEIDRLSREKKYFFNSISNKDNFLVWKSILYIKTVIFKSDLNNIVDKAINNSTEVNVNGLFKDYINIDVFYCSSLYYNLIIYYPEKCVDIIKKMNLNQISVFSLALSNPECIGIIKNKNVANTLMKIIGNEITRDDLSGILCLALKKNMGNDLTENETKIVKNYLNTNQFKSYSIFYKEYCDIVGFIFLAFGTLINSNEIDSTVNQYANAYKTYFELITGSYTITRFVSYIQRNLTSNSEATYHIRVLLGKALAFCDSDDSLIQGSMDYISNLLKDGGILIIYHTLKLYNPERFNNITNISAINKLITQNIYEDIDYSSTSDLLFMLSFITSSHNSLSCYDLLLNGLSNGMMRMNDSKDTIGDYKLLDSLELILKNNWLSTKQLIGYLDRIKFIADKMNRFHIQNDVHGKAIELLLKYDLDAAEHYYSQVSSLEDTYNFIHYSFAMNLINRGRNLNDVEKCLGYIKESYDRYHQKIERDSFNYKISIYLSIAASDFYSTNIQNRYFKKACEEIDEMEDAGWDRELQTKEYEIYTKLCDLRTKVLDVKKEQEREYHGKDILNENTTLLVLSKINTEDELKVFISKLKRDYIIDSIEINEMLIQKSIDLTGTIQEILKMLSDSFYPSNSFYSANSNNFWMTIVAAFNNPKAKASILEYLITHGGGHDGFNELIKIYAYIGNKDICLESFETMMNCIEFLLC